MAEHTEQIENLRKMAFEIATEMDLSTSSNPLQDEVEELGNRLESVRQSISLLADIADARSNNETECNQNIDDVKANLNEMKTVSAQFKMQFRWFTVKCLFSSYFRQ